MGTGEPGKIARTRGCGGANPRDRAAQSQPTGWESHYYPGHSSQQSNVCQLGSYARAKVPRPPLSFDCIHLIRRKGGQRYASLFRGRAKSRHGFLRQRAFRGRSPGNWNAGRIKTNRHASRIRLATSQLRYPVATEPKHASAFMESGNPNCPRARQSFNTPRGEGFRGARGVYCGLLRL